ncbi:MAG: hypothetical protein KH897_03430 [Bacteroides sp.]|jgi:hypothetical protein|uniref:hypothetical protein n=1 Tax=Bacteroides TaxID=816 RepID=UPI0005C5E659|nr:MULTISPECIES: hypothetical protein [Bacteroides]MBS6237436.1 hypothetical protein [Bacteroides sp.]
MAYANTTKEMLDSPLEWTVCLSKIDCIVLRPKIKEMLFVTRKQFERLSDIYESGESTEEQVKSYEKTKQKYNTLSTTLMAMDDVIREQF